MVVKRAKTTRFSEKSLRTLVPKIWNSLRENLENLISFQKFTEFMKTRYGPECVMRTDL